MVRAKFDAKEAELSELGWSQEFGEKAAAANLLITHWFGLERTFEDHLVQPPCNKQGHLPLDPDA